jgi:hypothetical protein
MSQMAFLSNVFPSADMATSISTTSQYILTNLYSNVPLAVDPTVEYLQLRASTTTDTSLKFNFTQASENEHYNICTEWDSIAYCLDVFGNNKTTPHLSTPGNYAGEQWIVNATQEGAFKLSNDFTGTGYYLDVYGNTKQAFMSTGDYSGQYWRLDEVGETGSTVSTEDPSIVSHVQCFNSTTVS